MGDCGHFLVVDRAPDGGAFVVDLHGRSQNRLITIGRHPTHEGAYAAALVEAGERGGLEVVDKIEGAE